MSENWGELPKIKMIEGEYNFSEFEPTNDTSSYNTDSSSSIDDYYSGESNNDNSKISINLEKPNENSKKKIILFFAIIFCIVTLPICYNMYKDYKMYADSAIEREVLNVTVKQFKPQAIYSTSEATGSVTPESSVDIVARVDGYLEKTFFKEGDNVKKGQLLFKIESEEYEIAVRAAEAAVAQAQAVYTNSLQELERGKELIKENFISRSDFDAMVATANSSKASLDEVKQSLARARFNLNYTKIYSPLSGKAGRIALSDGNFVSIGSGALVNIAKTNPICVSFSMKSSDVINIKQGDSNKLDLSTAKVELILSDGSKYNKVGKINFSDNYVSSESASLSLKAVFENPDNLLLPGDYVKVIVTASQPIHRIMVPQSITYGDALNGYYLWAVVDNKTVKKPIQVAGSRDNHWIVLSGINENDKIITKNNISIDMEQMNVAKIEEDLK